MSMSVCLSVCPLT